MNGISATINMEAVRTAYAALGNRVAKNLVKRALREALAPVREQQRTAWASSTFRQGRKKVAHTTAVRKRMRSRGTRPIVVRNAVRRSIAVKVDQNVKGQFTAGVGVDYGKRGVKGQQRFVHIIEGGRKSRALPVIEIGRRVNRQQQSPAEQRFFDAMMKGIERGS